MEGERHKCLLVDRYQVCCLLMAKLHIIAKHVYVQQLPNILLLVVLYMAQIVRANSKANKRRKSSIQVDWGT